MYIPGLNPDARDTVPQFDLGQLGATVSPNGTKAWIYVQANGAIDANRVTVLTNVFQASEGTASPVAGSAVGISTDAFADDEHGWVQIYGQATAHAGSALSATSEPGPDADGAIDHGTTAPWLNGVTLTGGAVTNNTNFTCHLNWPSVSAER